jgi:enoyl-CoA hydratase/carnithine racemase
VNRTETRPDLLRRREGEVEIISLNRPGRKNAMSMAMVNSLIDVLSAIEDDRDVRAVVLAGEGTGFCAGSDLGGLANMDACGRRTFEAASGRVARMISQCSKPVLAAVHGFAIGGGLTLATACDIVLSDLSAKWSLPEVPVGLFPAWGLGSVVRRAGVTSARRLSWGIDTLDGRGAQASGLADEVVEGNVLAIACERARALAALPYAQAQAVKHYFAAYCADEAADIAANRLFIEMTGSPEAGATFRRFGPKP